MTTDNGGWTLVDNDASNAGYFTSRQAGANDSISTTRGSYLPAYTWSDSPQLLVKASSYTGSVGWAVLYANDADAREYPTQTTVAFNVGTWAVKTLNGNTNQGVASWISLASSRIGAVWIGSGSTPTTACNYYGTGYYTGLGVLSGTTSTTCSTWVR
jgi:hypothetical protein